MALENCIYASVKSRHQLSAFFVNVGPHGVAGEVQQLGETPDPPCRLPRVGACAFSLTPLSLTDLRLIVSCMNVSSACGDDGVCMRAIRLAFEAIGDVLLHLINSCLSFPEVPESWKHSLVYPIFKSGDPTNPSNFRPISIVPAIAKVVERAVHQQLYAFLSQNHLLSPNQHGFRPRHSTETALASITDEILTATDRGDMSLLCLLDLSKCFDVISHKKLLTKLSAHCIDISWFSAYLQNHTQSVRIRDSSGNSKTSKKLPNSVGVFQGSALGPLMYSIFANDLSLFANDASVVQYADDTQILVSGKKTQFQNVVSHMERVLASLDLWFRGNCLKVNAEKTQLILFGSKQNLRNPPEVVVKFRDQTLTTCSVAKNLGVTFDQSLSWDAHVSHISRRCFGTLAGLSHLRHCLPPHVVSLLVNALVLSQIRYCISIYGNGTQNNLSRIQKVINYGAKVIFGRKKFDHVTDLLEKLGWFTAEELVKYHTLCLAHKAIRFGEPENLAREFLRVSETRDRSTRQDNDLHVPRSRTEAGKRRFSCRAPTLYNSLPPDVKQLPVMSFGRALKRHLRDDET